MSVNAVHSNHSNATPHSSGLIDNNPNEHPEYCQNTPLCNRPGGGCAGYSRPLNRSGDILLLFPYRWPTPLTSTSRANSWPFLKRTCSEGEGLPDTDGFLLSSWRKNMQIDSYFYYICSIAAHLYTSAHTHTHADYPYDGGGPLLSQ